MWKIGGVLESNNMLNQFDEFEKYLKFPVTGQPKGAIKPKKAQYHQLFAKPSINNHILIFLMYVNTNIINYFNF